MAKYYTYEGKQVGYIRKMVDEVVMIEESWSSEVNKHFAKHGYDELLSLVATVLQEKGFPAVTRAQAWMILNDVTGKGVPEALRNYTADEESGKGTLFADLTKKAKVAAASAADGVASAGKTVGGGVVSIASAPAKVLKKSDKDSDE
ncbi:MAG: hypothetical protein CMB45_05615 [Euryarchaeota archaeon]|nr:hypothetical protein [Euryarchaeota archaeon]MBK38452.1 hypothetical protein [Euryarchaeota archaeon]|tara:strand:+ start:3236 stop:3676 length:441 start_codon:yes stop_codon:yes gene_type:complete